MDGSAREEAHSLFLSAAWFLDPKYNSPYKHQDNPEATKDFIQVCEKIHHYDEKKAGEARRQWMVQYKQREGIFAADQVWPDAQKMPGFLWWEMYGGETPKLQRVAIQVFSVSATSSAC